RRSDSARRHRALGRLVAALASRGLFAARSLFTRLGSCSLGLFALVPGIAIMAAWRQAGVLGRHRPGCGSADLLAAGWRRVLATGALVAVHRGLVRRNQLVLATPDQVAMAQAHQ